MKLSNQELLSKYEISLRVAKRSENTIRSYTSTIKTLIIYINDEELLNVDPDTINAFLFSLGEVADTTYNNKLAALNSFYSYLLKNRRIQYSPVTVENRKVLKKEKEVLTDDDIRKLLKYADKKVKSSETDRQQLLAIRNRAIIGVLATSGCRIGEILTLTMSQLDLEEGILRVDADKSKGKKERYVSIGEKVSGYIKEYINLVGENEYVFVSKNGNILKDSNVYSMLNEYAEECGLSHIHPHMFRHYVGTRIYTKSHDIQLTSQILGHASITTTQLYVHEDRKDQLERQTRYNII